MPMIVGAAALIFLCCLVVLVGAALWGALGEGGEPHPFPVVATPVASPRARRVRVVVRTRRVPRSPPEGTPALRSEYARVCRGNRVVICHPPEPTTYYGNSPIGQIGNR